MTRGNAIRGVVIVLGMLWIIVFTVSEGAIFGVYAAIGGVLGLAGNHAYYTWKKRRGRKAAAKEQPPRWGEWKDWQ